MSHIASSFGRSGAQTASYGRLHDEDRHRPDPSHLLALPRKLLRVTRFNRVLVCLLLIDLMVVGMLIITLEPLITLLHRNDELFRPSILSPQDGPSTAPHQPTSPKIPRILHQTCANATVPHKWLESQQSCKDVYADFEYKVCPTTGRLLRLHSPQPPCLPGAHFWAAAQVCLPAGADGRSSGPMIRLVSSSRWSILGS